MRILFLSHCSPYPPDRGDKIRAYEQLKHLGRTHEIDLLAIAKERRDLRGHASLEQLCETVELILLDTAAARVRAVGGLLRGEPITLPYFRLAAFERSVERLARERPPDLIIAYTTAMAPYAQTIEGVPKLLDMVDVDSAKWAQYARFSRFPMRWVYRLEAERLRHYEAELSDRFQQIVVTTTRELGILRRIRPDVVGAAVRNGIDVDRFRPLDLPKAEAPTLVFTGQMDYFANVDAVVHFVTTSLPEIRRQLGDVRFLIVGRSPTRSVQALSSVPGVTVTGEVDEVGPYLATAWVFVAPLRIAQGIQNKVLEAMACGLPVVCSSPVADGLDAALRAGQHLLVGDDERLREALVELLRDEPRRREIGKAARRQVESEFSWRDSMNRFEALAQGTADQGRGS